jgi:hypothetical protein
MYQTTTDAERKLISDIQLADRHESTMHFDDYYCACPSLVNTLVNAIIDGNCIHERAIRQRNEGDENFTIPDAVVQLRVLIVQFVCSSFSARRLQSFVYRN